MCRGSNASRHARAPSTDDPALWQETEAWAKIRLELPISLWPLSIQSQHLAPSGKSPVAPCRTSEVGPEHSPKVGPWARRRGPPRHRLSGSDPPPARGGFGPAAPVASTTASRNRQRLAMLSTRWTSAPARPFIKSASTMPRKSSSTCAEIPAQILASGASAQKLGAVRRRWRSQRLRPRPMEPTKFIRSFQSPSRATGTS